MLAQVADARAHDGAAPGAGGTATPPKVTRATGVGSSMWPAERIEAGFTWHTPQSKATAFPAVRCRVWAPTRIGSSVPPPRAGSPA